MNSTEETDVVEDPFVKLNIPYTVCEIIVAITAIIGNVLVIYVFWKERKLRRRTNYYIISLAVADLLVGVLGIPFAILASIGLPTNLYLCLFTVSLLVVLCTISIFSLVAVSADRYWAILHPMGYSRNVRTRTTIYIIIACWVAGALVGFLPLFGWYNPYDRCIFDKVMMSNYLVFLYFATIILPALLLAAFYIHIYQVVVKQVRQIVTMSPMSIDGDSGPQGRSGGVMLRVLGAAQKREVKATQNLSFIVLFFIICWIPLYTINCIQAFCNTCEINHTVIMCCIILSHINSSCNPFLYAYHLKDFRAALKNFFGSSQTLNQSSIHSNILQSCHRVTIQKSTKKIEDKKIKEDQNQEIKFFSTKSEEQKNGVNNFLYMDDDLDDDVFVSTQPCVPYFKTKAPKCQSASVIPQQDNILQNQRRSLSMANNLNEHRHSDTREEISLTVRKFSVSNTDIYRYNERNDDLFHNLDRKSLPCDFRTIYSQNLENCVTYKFDVDNS